MKPYTLEDVQVVVGKTPYMPMDRARIYYDLICNYQLQRGLELGTFHGVSTCYLGAAFSQNDGSIWTVDLAENNKRQPHIREFIQKLGATNIGYTESAAGAIWEMHKLIRNQEKFDFIFIDADHTFEGCLSQVTLAKRLINPGGWLALDDLNWVPPIGSAHFEGWQRKDRLELREIHEVWEWHIKRDPFWCNFKEVGQWTQGLCQRV